MGGNSDAEFVKWETPNQEIEGVWLGQHDGKFGPVGTVETEDGKVAFALHTALVDKVSEIEHGTEIKIVYTGKAIGKKSGREFKAFDVFVSDGAPAEDDSIPF